MSKGLWSIGVLAAVLVLFIAVNVLAGAGLRGARLDLTQGRLYTLSLGSKNIAKKVEEPITLKLYYSERAGNDVPGSYKAFATRVKEMLDELSRASGGKIRVQVVNPEPFSEQEDDAVAAGLMGAPVGRGGGGGGERFFFGLVGRNATDKQEVIPFFRPEREEFLEYDLTHMVYLLSDPQKKVVGLMTWLPIEGMESNPMTGGRPVPAWQVVQQMKELFEVKKVATDAAEIPADVKVLMIVHPKNMAPKTQYAVDQFVMKGGSVLLFVDPYCEADLPPGINPMQAMQLPKYSSLKPLTDAWGLEMADGKFAADLDLAVTVGAATQGRPDQVNFVAYLQLGREQIERADPVTGDLTSMNVGSAGVLRKKEGAATTFAPLAYTTPKSAMLETTKIEYLSLDPSNSAAPMKQLIAEFVSGGQPLTLAARVTGTIKTAFPAGRPVEPPPTPKPGEPPKPEEPRTDPMAGHVAESKGPANIIVVADCDMLTDRFWVSEQRLGQISLGFSKFADNGDLVIGALDNLSGSSDLMALRARGSYARPFERLNQIQRQADQEFQQKMLELQRKMQETETKISDLQRQRPDGSNAAILTPEQQREIEKFREQRTEIRKELRAVKHQMNKDIERIQLHLKLLNMAAVPAIVGVAALGLGVWRSQRRRSVDGKRE